MPTWSEQITSANLSWELSRYGIRASQAFSTVGLTLDTGAPSTTIWQSNNLYVEPQFLRRPQGSALPYSGNFQSKVGMKISAPSEMPGGRDLNFSFLTGQTETVNKVSASVRAKDGGPTWSGYMNTGLMFYTHYDVMFDLEHGWVGFRPVKK
jgi:hypothetical protein